MLNMTTRMRKNNHRSQYKDKEGVMHPVSPINHVLTDPIQPSNRNLSIMPCSNGTFLYDDDNYDGTYNNKESHFFSSHNQNENYNIVHHKEIKREADEIVENMMTSCDMISSTSRSVSSSATNGSEKGLKPSSISVFSAMSTLHGLSHIFAVHQSRLRCFSWAIAFAVSFALLLYQSSNRVNYYLSYPHITRLDEVNEGNLPFPSITICNLNEFRFKKITKNDMYHAGQLLGFLEDSAEKKTVEAGFQPFNDYTKYVIKRVKDLTDFETGYKFCLLLKFKKQKPFVNKVNLIK